MPANDPKRPLREYSYREGERRVHLIEGEDKRWYENGQLMAKITYRNGIPDGPATMYFENGKLQGTALVKDGKGNGPSVEYYENGQKKEEGTVADDGKVGQWQQWDQWGRLVGIENYNSKHKEHGTFKEWYTALDAGGGKGDVYLAIVREYVDGEMVSSISYKQDGTVDRKWGK